MLVPNVVEEPFSLAELQEFLTNEIARADTSFQRTQWLARTALANDLLPGDERLVVHPLETVEMSVRLSLSLVRPSWLAMLQAWLSTVLAKLFWRPLPPADLTPRYRVVGQGEGDVSLEIVVKRNQAGTFQTCIQQT